jgi:ABC-type lipoprotein export system ATPase subunit
MACVLQGMFSLADGIANTKKRQERELAVSISWPEGSVWRKWDLHLHSPGTKKSDGYKVQPGSDLWDEYCQILEESDVYAFGVADYFSADGYFRARDEFFKRYPSSEKLFLANVELCLNVTVNKNDDYVNVHIVFCPLVSDDDIRSFLGKLKTSKTVAGGKPVFASDLSSTADYDEATTSHADIRKAIEDVFGDRDRLDKLLVISAINNDGIRPKAGVARRAAMSQELDKLSDLFFGNSKDSDYYLQTDRWDDMEHADAKAVVTGSDAHSFEDLHESLGRMVYRDGNIYKQSTWIKADVTYEGLKQIVFEPTGRVFIGDEPEIIARVRTSPRRFIKSISLNQITDYDGRHGTWFKDQKISLNPELVAIIGNKGSGKSAVTDAIGLLGNSHKQFISKGTGSLEELFSFLNKNKFLKQKCASNFEAILDWYGGVPETTRLDATTDTARQENVEYLPQKYLERICAQVEEDEFRFKLNEVIFGYVKPSEQFDKKSIEELSAYLTSQATADISQAVVELHEKNEDVVRIERCLTGAYRTEIETRLQGVQRDLAAHIAAPVSAIAKPAEDDPRAAEVAETISILDQEAAALKNSRAELLSEQSLISRRAEDLSHARQAIGRKVAELEATKSQYADLFEKSGIRYEDVLSVTFNPAPIETAEQALRDRVRDMAPSLRTIAELQAQGATSAPVQDGDPHGAAKAASIDFRLQEIDSTKLQLVDQLNRGSREYQGYLLLEQAWQLRKATLEGSENGPAENTVNWLKQELSRVDASYPAALVTARSARLVVSKRIHALRKKLLEFQNKIKVEIDNEIAVHGKDLRDYNITIQSELRLKPSFYTDFLVPLNMSRRGSFHGSEDGRAHLQRLVEQVVDWQDESAVTAILDRIVGDLDVDAKSKERRDIFDQLKNGRSAVEFYDYVFGLSYLEPVYDLKVDGKTLIELSPGERGGVLLVFYLMLDKRDIPLVIDQPEDNLDNKSVFEILVKFLKQAKKRRQIIIATHNPNLAVVADAEQIINVMIDKRNGNEFSFKSGAIENEALNRAVIDILEGTMPAFDNRRIKYRRKRL